MGRSYDEGKAGEEAAASFLERKGYRILEQNYRVKGGEIDIIAQKGSYLVFAEIKERREDSLVSPLEAVTPQKQRRIIRTALLYLMRFPSPLQPRFDVLGLVREENGHYRITHIENAFQGGNWN